MSAIYGLYAGPDAAQRAVDGLRAAGLPARAITVLSAEPYEDYAFSHRDRATRMSGIAVGGGAGGLALGAWLTRMTEQAWPLPTGGMPIVAPWPNLIVLFELTMLGAVLATVGTLLVTARLLRRRPALYDPAVSDGLILVGVDGRDDLRPVLAAAGATRVHTLA